MFLCATMTRIVVRSFRKSADDLLHRPTRSRVWPGLLATWVLVLTIEAAPHLVHHLLDDDPPTCGFLALLSDTPGLLERGLDVPKPAARTESVGCRPQVVCEHPFRSPYGPRAPPPSCLRWPVI